MSEQPEQNDPADGHSAEGTAEDFGTVSFGRVSGGTLNGLPYLSTLDYHFDDGAPDPEVGGRAFAAASTELHGALASYRSVVASLGTDTGRSFISGNEDPGLVAASDHVQEAFEGLGLSHRAWTGHSFMPGPLYRDEPNAFDDSEATAQLLEAEEEARENEEAFGPRLHELPVTVIVDQILHHSKREVLRLDTVRVHSNGLLLEFNYVNLRGANEDALSWYRRSNERLGDVELGLSLQDRTTGTMYPGEVNGGDGNCNHECYRLNHRFWIHRALEAEALSGTFTAQNVSYAEVSTEPLIVEFQLETATLRDAARRVRTLGNHEPPA